MLDEPIFLLLTVILAGKALGSVRILSFSLGSSGILFAALAFGHFGHVVPSGLQTLGLVLFIYAVGLQAGPGFVASFRRMGLRLTVGALAIVATGLAATVLCALAFGFDTGTAAGVLAGALTSTPGLAVAVELGGPGAAPAAYGVTYSVGVIGVILCIGLLPRLLRVNLEREAEALAEQQSHDNPRLTSCHLAINNPNLYGRTVAEIDLPSFAQVTLTRLLREGSHEPVLVDGATTLQPGDRVRVVGRPADLDKATLYLGARVDEGFDIQRVLERRRVLVSQPRAVGLSLGEANFRETFHVQVSRITRNGIELPPTPDRRFHMGDVVDFVGDPGALQNVARALGDDVKAVYSPVLVPIIIGLALGMLVGYVPLTLPLVGSFRLGTAGGVLLAGLVLGRLHKTGPFLWAVPVPTLELLRDLGLVLFLATVGTQAGATIVDTMAALGLPLLVSGLVVTAAPLVVGVLVGRYVLRLPVLRLLGVIAGGMTSTPGLASSASLSSTAHAAAAYATVYPAALIGMILAVKATFLLLG